MLPFERLLARLQAFDSENEPVLSLYFVTGPRPHTGPNIGAQLTDLVRPIGDTIDADAEREQLDRAAARARELAYALSPLPRAVALFVCPGRSFEAVIPLSTELPSSASWSNRIDLLPLIRALDELERAAVVLVDKSRARIFQVCMGEIEEVESIEDDVPGRHREGRSLQRAYQGRTAGLVGMGYDSPTIQRHHEWHVRRHIDRVLGSLARASRPPLLGRIFVAGPDEAVSELKRLMAPPLRRRLAGEVRVSVDASPAEVLVAVRAAQEVAERQEEHDLVAELIERPARTRLGAVAVAEAVADGQVYLLVHSEGASLRGGACETCGWLIPGDPPMTCPRCRGAVRPTEDLVALMLNRVLDLGGRVEAVRGAAADLLADADGLGAYLRYVPTLQPVSI